MVNPCASVIFQGQGSPSKCRENRFDVSSSLRESTTNHCICLRRPRFFIKNGLLAYLCAECVCVCAYIYSPCKAAGEKPQDEGEFVPDTCDDKVGETCSVLLAQWFPVQHATRTLETEVQAGNKRGKKKEAGDRERVRERR